MAKIYTPAESYDHPDVTLGTVKALKGKTLYWKRDTLENSIGFSERIIAGKWFDPQNDKHIEALAQALREQYHVNCHCLHDCCGCMNGYGLVRYKGKGVFTVQAHYARNY